MSRVHNINTWLWHKQTRSSLPLEGAKICPTVSHIDAIIMFVVSHRTGVNKRDYFTSTVQGSGPFWAHWAIVKLLAKTIH